MSGEAEDEVASLSDVDIVPSDVVEEQETLARGQAVHVDPAQVDHVVITAALLHQHCQQEHHLVQGGSTSW